jgi:hypothetical protein
MTQILDNKRVLSQRSKMEEEHLEPPRKNKPAKKYGEREKQTV